MDEPKGTPTAAAEILEIGGRRWRSIVTRKMRLEVDLEAILYRAGLEHIQLKPGERAEEVPERILRQLMADGAFFAALGHLLVPAELPDSAWSPGLARQTGAFMEGLTAAADKAILTVLVVQLVVGFFERALSLEAASGAASSARRAAEPAGGTRPA